MALSSDQLLRVQQAATLGGDIEGFDPEEMAAYEEIISELDAFEGKTMVEPVFDWPDDRYDDLIETTEAAWGAPRTLADMTKAAQAESTLVSKSVEERMFTLGPMYIPNRKDAHAEWTDPDELQKAVWDYVRKGDRRIRLQHNRDVVAGEFVEIMAWPYEVEVPMVRKDGSSRSMTFPADTVFLGVVWEPWAWQMVKDGKLLGYSIGGRAERLLVDLPEESVAKALETTMGDDHPEEG